MTKGILFLIIYNVKQKSGQIEKEKCADCHTGFFSVIEIKRRETWASSEKWRKYYEYK